MERRYYRYDSADEHQAKSVIRDDMGKICLILITVILLSNLLSMLFILLFSLGGVCRMILEDHSVDFFHAFYRIHEMQESSVGNFIAGYLPVIVSDIVGILMAKKLLTFSYYPSFWKKPGGEKGFSFWGILSTSGISLLGMLATYLLLAIFAVFGLEVYGPDFALPQDSPLISALILLYGCILGPIMEEIIFRGYFLNRLKRHGKFFAAVITSLLFALFHMNLVQFFAPFFIGILFSYLALETNSIRPAIIAHILNNSVAFALDFLPSETAYWILYLLYAAVGVIAFFVFRSRYQKQLQYISQDNNAFIPARQQLKAAFSGPAPIIYLIIYGINILLLFSLYA